MKNALDAWTPPGIRAAAEIKWIAAGLSLSFLYSLKFVFHFLSHRSDLLWMVENVPPLQMPEVSMPGFFALLDHGLAGFAAVAVCMAGLALYHWFYHYQGSKSIYLMRRLPQRWELLRRCAALPALGAAACLFTALLLLALYCAIYLLFTPDGYLPLQPWHYYF